MHTNLSVTSASNIVTSRVVYGFLVNFVAHREADGQKVTEYAVYDDHTEHYLGLISSEVYQQRCLSVSQNLVKTTGLSLAKGSATINFGPYQDSRVRHWLGCVQAITTSQSLDGPATFTPDKNKTIHKFAATFKLVPQWFLIQDTITFNSTI